MEEVIDKEINEIFSLLKMKKIQICFGNMHEVLGKHAKLLSTILPLILFR